MKFQLSAALLFSATALAAPALEARQLLGSTSNDYVNGGCKPVIMAYARGSTEAGNVGTLGPDLKDGLNSILRYRNNFALQGVEYPASLADNFLPLGTSTSSINEMVRLVTDIATNCPTAHIALGGYSQGAALTARTVERLPQNIKDRIKAVVLFGYTLNQQLDGGIPGFPQDKIEVFCNLGDLVCHGTLTITPTHLTYGTKVNDAVSFIYSKIGRL